MKIFNSFIILLLLIVVGSIDAFANQNRVIKGKVMDAVLNEPLPGVTISVKNETNNGTITDFDGCFTLNVKEGEITLKFSYVGYATQEVKVTSNQREITCYFSLVRSYLDFLCSISYIREFQGDFSFFDIQCETTVKISNCSIVSFILDRNSYSWKRFI